MKPLVPITRRPAHPPIPRFLLAPLKNGSTLRIPVPRRGQPYIYTAREWRALTRAGQAGKAS